MSAPSARNAQVAPIITSTPSLAFWLTLGFVTSVLALPGLAYFSKTELFALIFGARLLLALAAIIIGLAQAARITQLSETFFARAFFFTALALEISISLRVGALQPGLGLLAIWILAAPIAKQRVKRLDLETSTGSFRALADRVQKQLAELRAAISKFETNTFFSSQRSQENNMIAFPNGKSLQTTTHTLVHGEPKREEGRGPQLSLHALLTICEMVVQEKRAQYQDIKKLSILLTRPQTVRTDVVALGDFKDTKRILEGAVDLAVRSIGGGEGLVRLSLSSSLRHVSVSIDDNGYGMSEERLAMAGGPTLFTYAKMRGLVAFWGGRLVRQARLGVGSRVVIEMPRVDAFTVETLVDRKQPTPPEHNPEV